MPDYSKGKIYSIRFYNSNAIYIGSTIQPLAVRFGGHKVDKKCSLFQSIQNKYNGDWSACYYELLENCSCSSKEDLCKKEGEIIRKFKADENFNCINMRIAGRSPKEYCQDEKVSKKKYYQEYYEKNKDKVLKQKSEYNKNNKERKKEYDREYRKNNKEELDRYNKYYYELNKEKLLSKQSCGCGGYFIAAHKNNHEKTKRHQMFINSQKSES
jgi:hypothetical protein